MKKTYKVLDGIALIMKRLLKILGCIVLVLIIAILGWIIFIPIVNDSTAEQVAKRLEEIPLPEKTELLETKSLAGKLVGCGNGMQYFGAILVKSDLALDELKVYYGKYANDEYECIVEIQDTQQIQQVENEDLVFDSDMDSGDYFIVYSWEDNGNFLCALDLRAN